MSDSSYYDDGVIGASDTNGWDDQFPYVDEDGLRYSEEDAQQLIASGEYQFVDDEPFTPDTPIADYGGATLRNMWDTLPANERAAARQAYAVERYQQLKEQNG